MHLFYTTRYKVVYWRKLLYWVTAPASLDGHHTQGGVSHGACNECPWMFRQTDEIGA